MTSLVPRLRALTANLAYYIAWCDDAADKIAADEALLRQALTALESLPTNWGQTTEMSDAIDTLRIRLKEKS